MVALALPCAALAQDQQFRVRVVEPFALERYAREGAVGLLATRGEREHTLRSLVTGELRHPLLGPPQAEALIQLGGPARGGTILVSLPARGRTRTPIAIVGAGFRGLLVSDRTRIPGLVSLADVAPTALGRDDGLTWRVEDGAPGRLKELDGRIDRNGDVRLPLTLGAAVAVAALALAAPRRGVAALLLLLGGNLVAGLAALLARRDLLLAVAAAGVIAAYAFALWLAPADVALSPLGPSQSGRFYGLSNLLSTLLLVPALVGTALLWPWGAAVGLLGLVTVGASALGADGGGAVVLATGLVMLALRLRSAPLTLGRVAVAVVGGAALALGVVGLDAAAGGSSHVTDALAGELVGDLGDRLELSARRAVSSWGAAVVVAAGLAVLGWYATRRQRFPISDALLVAVAVSLLVNDTPTDVAGLGALVVGTVRRWEDSRSAGRV